MGFVGSDDKGLRLASRVRYIRLVLNIQFFFCFVFFLFFFSSHRCPCGSCLRFWTTVKSRVEAGLIFVQAGARVRL